MTARGHSEGITMSGGGVYSLATLGAKHVIDAATPLVVEVEGESRRLTGTAEAQYEGWRKLLREIYQAETGFTEVVDVGEPARSGEPTG